MIKFTIYGSLPNLNEYTDACRKNHFSGAKMKKQSQEICEWSIRSQCKGRHLDSCDVSIKWIEKNQRRDPDNIAFAKKFIFDALVECKVLDNDGWKQIKSMKDEFAVDKMNPRIEVELYESSG